MECGLTDDHNVNVRVLDLATGEHARARLTLLESRDEIRQGTVCRCTDFVDVPILFDGNEDELCDWSCGHSDDDVVGQPFDYSLQ